jgi:hypothetical protein
MKDVRAKFNAIHRINDRRQRFPPFKPSFQPTLRCPVSVFFGPRGGPSPCFPFPLKRGEWSAGRRQEVCQTSLRPVCETDLCVVRRRTGPCEGPCASRRSIADRVVGGRTLLRHPTSRSTTPSIEQGMAEIDQGAGSAKWETRVCKVLQHFGRSVPSPACGEGLGRGAARSVLAAPPLHLSPDSRWRARRASGQREHSLMCRAGSSLRSAARRRGREPSGVCGARRRFNQVRAKTPRDGSSTARRASTTDGRATAALWARGRRARP